MLLSQGKSMLSTSRYKNNNALNDWLWVGTDTPQVQKLEVVVYLEVGDQSPEDKAYFPDDDIKAVMMDGKWSFQHKDGRLY